MFDSPPGYKKGSPIWRAFLVAKSGVLLLAFVDDYHILRPDNGFYLLYNLIRIIGLNGEFFLDETKVAPWRIWLRNIAAWLFIPALIFLGVVIGIHHNSAEHWGKRYHAVCNHPLQKNETILSHRGDAYELVLAFFDKGEDEREKMKAHIREQEQKLKRLEIEANEEKDPAKKR